jgi:RNA 2',3'-cyclic 3'-phosphodiesterase
MSRDRAPTPEARSLRLFVAVDVPAAVRDSLQNAIRPLHETIPGARWTRPDAWHVTMKFLGNVEPRLRGWVEGAVGEAAAEAESLESRMKALGAFPSPRKARVMWAGLEDPNGSLVRLAGTLDRLLEREFPPGKRPFTPHLTLARFKEQAALPDDALAVPIDSAVFMVDRLVLYRSHLQRPHAVYEPLRMFPFSGRGP